MVNNQGELVVRAPYYVSNNMIMDFVTAKQSWITKQQQRVEKEKADFVPAVIAPGGIIQYSGSTYNIDIEDVEEITLFGNYILLPPKAGSAELRQWLQQQALHRLKQRVSFFAHSMQAGYKRLRISSAKSRWGSCSYYNVLSFSWRLIMCPPEVLDYVVVHELSHVENKSHNKKFWQQVEEVLPHYRSCEQWLKNNRRIMEIL